MGNAHPSFSQLTRAVWATEVAQKAGASPAPSPDGASPKRRCAKVWHYPSSVTVSDEYRLAAASPAPGSRFDTGEPGELGLSIMLYVAIARRQPKLLRVPGKSRGLAEPEFYRSLPKK
jgi:hypothetical protein